jgi:hypothetical protein
LPLGHAVQAVGEVEPAAEVNPTAQLVQVGEEVLGWNLPLGQILHEVELPASELNVPAAQARHAEPAKEYRPLGQATHEEGEVEPAAVVLCPAAQAVHAPRLPAASA